MTLTHGNCLGLSEGNPITGAAGDSWGRPEGYSRRVVRRRRGGICGLAGYIVRVLAHTTRALQLLFETIRTVDTREELARVGMVVVELYDGDAATLRELMQAIEARAVVLREQLRLFPATPIELPRETDLEPAPPDLVREWCDQVRMMGPDELNAIEELTHKHWERASLRQLRGAIENRPRQLCM